MPHTIAANSDTSATVMPTGGRVARAIAGISTVTTTAARRAALVTTETTSHTAARPVDWGLQVYRLQRVMWQISRDKTLAGCHRWACGAGVGVTRGPGTAAVVGLQNSHSVWGSPLAALPIIRTRRDEVAHALKTHIARGGGALFLTFTVRHKKGQKLAKLWRALAKLWTRTTSGSGAWNGTKRSVGDKQRYGIEHWIKSVEVTYGENGWHPHVHVVMLTTAPLTGEEVDGLAARLRERWINAALKEGLAAPSATRALDVQQLTDGATAADLAGYLTKGMISGLSAESTGGALKEARNGNRTPFQVLESLAAAEAAGADFNPADVAIWHEWEAASKGRRFMAWSKGAKEALGVDEVADEEIEQDDLDADLIVRIARREWKKIQSDVHKRVSLVRAVESAPSIEAAQRVALALLAEWGVMAEAVIATAAHEEMGALVCDSARGRPEVVRAEARAVLAG